MAHAGSWFGLPDFGLTEKLTGNKTTQGGSNIIGSAPKASSPAVQGANTGPNLGTLNVSGPFVPISQLNNPGSSNNQRSNNGFQPGQNGYVNPGGGEQVDPYAQIKADISGAWDNYISSLGGLESGLVDQRSAQENIANTQYQTGVDQINQQKASSLRDISGNIKNAFQAGNIYLGSRGAGDSSAASQYQFALSKEAGKQTGQLNEFVNGQLSTLKSQNDVQMSQIASWFADAQNQLKQQIANGQLSKAQDINNLSKDILNQALSAANEVRQNATLRENALMEWAANNSTNINQLKSNIAAIPQAIGAPMVGSDGSFQVATGYGSGTNEKTDIFGRPIR